MSDLWKGKLDAVHKWTAISLDQKEWWALTAWINMHQCPGDFVIAQTRASGIGTNSVVRCNKCKKGLDFTNYEGW
jgi:hypothetical protein